MQQHQEQPTTSEPKYHLTRKAISQIREIARSEPEDVEAQVLSDLEEVGEKPTIGVALDSAEIERVYGSHLSPEELARLKASRVFRGDICSLYWTVERLEDYPQSFAAVWAIILHQGDEEPVAMPDRWTEWWIKTEEKVLEKVAD